MYKDSRIVICSWHNWATLPSKLWPYSSRKCALSRSGFLTDRASEVGVLSCSIPSGRHGGLAVSAAFILFFRGLISSSLCDEGPGIRSLSSVEPFHVWKAWRRTVMRAPKTWGNFSPLKCPGMDIPEKEMDFQCKILTFSLYCSHFWFLSCFSELLSSIVHLLLPYHMVAKSKMSQVRLTVVSWCAKCLIQRSIYSMSSVKLWLLWRLKVHTHVNVIVTYVLWLLFSC